MEDGGDDLRGASPEEGEEPAEEGCGESLQAGEAAGQNQGEPNAGSPAPVQATAGAAAESESKHAALVEPPMEQRAVEDEAPPAPSPPPQKTPSQVPVDKSPSPEPAAVEEEQVSISDPRSLKEMFGQRNDLLEAYVAAKSATGGKVNHLVERSLTESMLTGGETFFIEAPGRHPLVFSNRLGDADMKIFSQVFCGAAHFLQHLDLSYNLITDAGINELCLGLLSRKSLSLQSLVLRGNDIGPRGCDKLCQNLRKRPSFLGLDISQNPLGRVGGLMLVEFLQQSGQLLELQLADTEVDIDVLVALSAVLLAGNSQLKVMNLENPRIETLQEDHTVHIGRMLRMDTQLSEIHLGKHRIRDDGVRQLVSFLLENKTLRILNLRNNELGADGAMHLGTLLRMDCQLVQLDLSNCRIGEKGNLNGAKAIAEALTSNRMLKHLDLNSNGLCGDALQLLGAAVDQNSTLQSIALFHSYWDQLSAYKFHQILSDRARILPLCADFVTSEVELRIDICQVQDFEPAR